MIVFFVDLFRGACKEIHIEEATTAGIDVSTLLPQEETIVQFM